PILRFRATGAPNAVVVFWSEVAGASGYKVYQSDTTLAAAQSARPPANTTQTTVAAVTNAVINLSGNYLNQHYFLVTALSSGVESNTNSQQVVASANPQIFNTVSGNGNTVWLDRNLGAARVATASNDEQAYGGYYQYGRPPDGHQLADSPVIAERSDTRFPAHGNFIGPTNNWLGGGFNDYTALQAYWSNTDGSSVCPTGFRVATASVSGGDWDAEKDSWISQDPAGAFASNLKLPVPGFRDANKNLEFTWRGVVGSYIAPANRRFQLDSSNTGSFAVGAYGHGNSIRCIRDASVSDTIPVPDIQITVSGIALTAAEVLHGSSLTLTAIISPSNAATKTVAYSISGGNNAIASIDADVITGISPGTVTLVASATDGSGFSQTHIFTVNPVEITSIQITNAAEVLHRSTLSLSATSEPDNASIKTINWSIKNGDNSIASISGNTLSGIAPGTVILVASATDGSGITAEQNFSVNPILVTSFTINQTSANVGQNITLTADITPANASDTTISWSIENNDNSIASLNGNILTGIAPGIITLNATANGGTNITAEQTFIVRLPAPASLGAIATGAPNQIIVYWQAVSGANGYKLYQSADNLSAEQASDPAGLSAITPLATAQTSATIDLAAGEQAYFLVTATNAENESLTNAEQATARANDFEFNTVAGNGLHSAV
ncbi:MAG: hypothetical protein HAW58_06550, partial [Candidatus Thioglobus sp.]|nr:hypothetical protein [Candidatus Thioglobus sp.]